MELIDALKAARVAGEAADCGAANANNGNFDTAVIVLDRKRTATVLAVGKEAGLKMSKRRVAGEWRVWLKTADGTQIAEAIAESLKANGFKAYTMYILD